MTVPPARRLLLRRDDQAMAQTQAALRVRGLRKRYGDLTAVDGIDLDVHRGEVFALLGPNGAGKTTTVEICEGYRSRDAGEVSCSARIRRGPNAAGAPGGNGERGSGSCSNRGPSPASSPCTR
jgi:ABC-type uncharacterized transport system ATPase subunit